MGCCEVGECEGGGLGVVMGWKLGGLGFWDWFCHCDVQVEWEEILRERCDPGI